MKKPINLKDCPFCGSKAKGSPFNFIHIIHCSNRKCEASVSAENKRKAALAWNRRMKSESEENVSRVIGLLTEARDVLGLTVAELRAENEQLRKELAEARGGAS